MIAIFTILGLLLFGGGAYAIYDGWPYLVLERGFTQVIIGSIASGAGLILMSLAWVLKEVKVLRRELVEALELRAELPVRDVAAADVAPFAPPAAPRAEYPSFSPAIAPAAIGAVAGAVATGAVAQGLSSSDTESAPASAEVEPPREERDLFGTLVARNLQEPEPVAEDEPEPAAETAAAEDAEPLPDMFEEALSAAPLQPPGHPFSFEADEQEPADPVVAKALPAAEEESVVEDEPSSFVDELSDERALEEQIEEEQPSAHAGAVEAPAAAASATDLDEFSALRASLAGHLNEPERETGRIEPSFSREPDPFASAEAWMDRASPRQEPWLDAPPAEQQPAVADVAPLWPPRTEPQVFDIAPEPEAVEEPIAAETPVREEWLDAPIADEQPDIATVEEPQVEQAPAAADPRPASDEGIVGAYQVGDAHFTIYADGSIRARTPDGEYSFASMDELKVYLASEKSRLGV
ncbi:hypothetical protein [Bosea sp. MMO-172]|uniref:hypothetical protein n=1 Tax=Bosea sp. MMO-172 TaxID=3127885 RepID=UPI0030173C49